MSRPLTKGPTLGVRLPLALDAALRRAAEARGLSPTLYAQQLLSAALADDFAPPITLHLPLATDRALRDRAGERPLDVYLADALTRSVAGARGR